MCSIAKLTFLVFVHVLQTDGNCIHSYVTFCDDLADFKKYNVENWTEVVVGAENNNAELRSVDANSFRIDRFKRMTHLTVVRLINDIKSYTFSFDPEDWKLEYLKFYGNEVERIRFTTFDNMRLRKLSLVNNSIEYFHKGAFYNCEIRTIDLSDNKLEMIEADVFSDEFLRNATKELIVRNNRLAVIGPKSLPTSLERLDLSYNNIQVLQYSILENLQSLQELDLSHNRISSPPGLLNLKNIRIVDVSYNKILTLRVAEFKDLSQLEVLDLSHNRISYPLTFNKFNFPERHPSLQISLAFNKLSHLILEDDSFRHHVVFLFGNPWDCGCWSILEKFMVERNVKRNQCDLEYFGKGQVPYCITYPVANNCTQPVHRRADFTSPEIEQFLAVINRSADNIKCSLKPRKL